MNKVITALGAGAIAASVLFAPVAAAAPTPGVQHSHQGPGTAPSTPLGRQAAEARAAGVAFGNFLRHLVGLPPVVPN